MKIINNFRQKIKQNPVSSTLIIILILVVITLGVPYIQNDDKSKANEDLINSITNPQNIPGEFLSLTEDFSNDQINSIKDLTDKFSIEQIIELEKRLVTDNFDLIDVTIDEESSEEFLSGSISVKKQYEVLNLDYENLIIDYKNLAKENQEINEINNKNKNQLISVALENQNLKNKATSLEEKVLEIKELNENNNKKLSDNHKEEISVLNRNISNLNDDIDDLNIKIVDIRDSYKTGNQILSTKVRTGQSANFKFNWLEVDKLRDSESRYLRMDLNDITEVNPYNFRLMNYLPTGSMIPLLKEDTLGLVHKTNQDDEFFVGDIVSYVPPSFDDSPGDMEGCDLGLESIAKTNYNHVSHRIIDKKWDEEDEDWNYLPKGDQNALHDGCFIKSKDIKYKLEMLIKINN